MPRRLPAQLRLDNRIRSALRSSCAIRTDIDGISAGGMSVLRYMEIEHRWPGATIQALRLYERALRDPAHRLRETTPGCGVLECCSDPSDLRDWLERVVRALPPRDRHRFRARVDQIDDLW